MATLHIGQAVKITNFSTAAYIGQTGTIVRFNPGHRFPYSVQLAPIRMVDREIENVVNFGENELTPATAGSEDGE